MGIFFYYTSPVSNPQDPNKEHTIHSNEIFEQCFRLEKGEKVNYSFSSNNPLDFNIHYHTTPSESKYSIQKKGIKNLLEKLNPLVRQDYCFMWENPLSASTDLSYSIHRILQKEKELKEKESVSILLSENEQQLIFKNIHQKQIHTLDFSSKVLNYSVDPLHDVLVILTSSSKETIQFFDLNLFKVRHTIERKDLPRHLLFSEDGGRVLISSQHQKLLTIYSTRTGKKIQSLQLDEEPLNISLALKKDQFWLRMKEQVYLMNLIPLELLEKNAKIPIQFGGKTLMVNPGEWCFVHGVAHPLYIAGTINLKTEGIVTYITRNKL